VSRSLLGPRKKLLQERLEAVEDEVWALQVSMATYTGPRHMVTSDNVAVGPIFSRQGVPAGSPHAIFEVALYMLWAIRYLESLYPSVCWSLFVDDLAIKVTHATPKVAAITAVHAAGAAILYIRDELGLPLDWKRPTSSVAARMLSTGSH
jgi:hypothetical protein